MQKLISMAFCFLLQDDIKSFDKNSTKTKISCLQGQVWIKLMIKKKKISGVNHTELQATRKNYFT